MVWSDLLKMSLLRVVLEETSWKHNELIVLKAGTRPINQFLWKLPEHLSSHLSPYLVSPAGIKTANRSWPLSPGTSSWRAEIFALSPTSSTRVSTPVASIDGATLYLPTPGLSEWNQSSRPTAKRTSWIFVGRSVSLAETSGEAGGDVFFTVGSPVHKLFLIGNYLCGHKVTFV